jgi:hypothetical protein
MDKRTKDKLVMCVFVCVGRAVKVSILNVKMEDGKVGRIEN